MSTYLLFNKPYGVLAEFGGGDGRPGLGDYVPLDGLFEAGRLDFDSEGLMLLTDDGALAHRVTHPRYRQPKTYLVQVEGLPTAEALAALRRGVLIKGQYTQPVDVELLPEEPRLPSRSQPVRTNLHVPVSWLRIVLAEGRKREVRHMTAAAGHPTLRLVRVALGPLTLGELQPGQWRRLDEHELARLKRACGLQP